MPTKTRLRAGITIAALALPALLGACGDDDADADAGSPTTTAEEAVDTTTTTEPAEPGTVVLDAVDYAYDNAPETVAAGTALDMRNVSDVEAHEALVFRLPEGEERTGEELITTVQDPAEFGEMVGVAIAMPGDEQSIFPAGPIVLDEPGRYLVTCFIPTGVDPQAYAEAVAAAQGGPPDIQGGPPHTVQGMWTEIVVG